MRVERSKSAVVAALCRRTTHTHLPSLTFSTLQGLRSQKKVSPIKGPRQKVKSFLHNPDRQRGFAITSYATANLLKERQSLLLASQPMARSQEMNTAPKYRNIAAE